MGSVVVPAVLAVVAALGGVTLGALVEPLKLGAARRAQVRTDRATRCAALIETAMNCRLRLLSLNHAHRQLTAGEHLEGASKERRLQDYRIARNAFRQSIGLVILSGPDELVTAAMAVREAEHHFRALRYLLDEGGKYSPDQPPAAVFDAAQKLEQAVYDFAAIARRYSS